MCGFSRYKAAEDQRAGVQGLGVSVVSESSKSVTPHNGLMGNGDPLWTTLLLMNHILRKMTKKDLLELEELCCY